MSRRKLNYNEFQNEKRRLQDEEKKLLEQDSKLDRELENTSNDDEQYDSENQNHQYEENQNEENFNENESIDESEKIKDDEKEENKDVKDEKENNEEDNKEEDDSKDEDQNESKNPQKNKSEESKNNTNSEDRKKLGPSRGQDKDNAKNDDKSGDKSNIKDAIKNKAADKISEQIGDKDGKIAKAQEMVTKAATAIKSVVNGSAIVAKLLIDPVFWIAIALLIVVAAIASTVAIIGGNDYNKACDSNGVGSVNIATDADDFTRQSGIASWLMSTPFEINGGKPMTKEQAAGIIGNFIHESMGANPKSIQGDFALTKWQSCNNDCVLGWGGGGGKAIGIAQWDSGRRVSLVKFAKSEGTEWHDLTTQLKFLKQELDGGYEVKQLQSGGFNNPSKSVEDYTEIWLTKFERAGVAASAERQKYAKDFYSKYAGGGSLGSSGLATQCVGGAGGTSGAIDSSNLVQLALQVSYTIEETAAGRGYGVCASLPHCGDSFSKPEYIAAKKLAEEKTGADSGAEGLTASCDRLAATLFRLTGVDEEFPWGGSAAQISYMNSSPKWKRVSCQERQPGDAIARPGHIMVYLGKIDGQDTIASASIALSSRVGNGQGRAAQLSHMSCKGDSWYADAANSMGWRRVK